MLYTVKRCAVTKTAHRNEKKKFRFYLFLPESCARPPPAKVYIYLKLPQKGIAKKKLKPEKWFDRLWVTKEIEIKDHDTSDLKYRFAITTATEKLKEQKTTALNSTHVSQTSVNNIWNNFEKSNNTVHDTALSQILKELITDKSPENMCNLPAMVKPMRPLNQSHAFYQILNTMLSNQNMPSTIAEKMLLILVIDSKTKDRGQKFLEYFKRTKELYNTTFYAVFHHLTMNSNWNLEEVLTIHKLVSVISTLSDSTRVLRRLEDDFIGPLVTKQKLLTIPDLGNAIKSIQPLLPKLPDVVAHFEKLTIEELDRRSFQQDDYMTIMSILFNTQPLFQARESIVKLLQRLKTIDDPGIVRLTGPLIDLPKVQNMYTQDELHSYLCDWMSSRTTRTVIPKYYEHYHQIEQTDFMQGLEAQQQQQIQEVVFAHIKHANVPDILNASEKIEKASTLFYRQAKEVIQHKVRSSVFENSLVTFVDGFGCCNRTWTTDSYIYVVQKSHTARLLVDLLDAALDHRRNFSDVDTIAFFVVNHKFWKWVCLIDADTNIIKDSEAMKTVQNFATEVVQHLKQQTISCQSLLALRKQVNVEEFVDCLVSVSNKAKDYVNDVWQQALHKLDEYQQRVQDMDTMVRFLLKFQNTKTSNGQYIQIEDKNDIAQTIQRFNDILNQNGEHVPLHQVDNMDFWNKHANLEYLYTVSTHRNKHCLLLVFTNYITRHRKVLSVLPQSNRLRKDMALLELPETSTDNENRPVKKQRPNMHYAHMEDIARAVWETEYAAFVELLFNNFAREGDITLGSIAELFEGIHDIEKEMVLLATFCPVMKVHAKRGMEFWKNKASLTELYNSIHSLCQSFSIEFEPACADALRLLHTIKEGNLSSRFVAFYRSMDNARRKVGHIPEMHCEFIRLLAKSTGTVGFLKKVINEHLPLMLNAVGQYSEEFIDQNTIKALISVHAKIRPLFSQLMKEQTKLLSELMSNIGKLHISPEILKALKLCTTHITALDSLYMNLTNRKEVEKIQIKSMLTDCEVHFKGENDNVQIELTNERPVLSGSAGQEEKSDEQNYVRVATMDFEEAKQLKTKVLLLINTAATAGNDKEKDQSETNRNRQFIELMDVLDEVYERLSALQREGHLNYQSFNRRIRLKKLLSRNALGDYDQLDKHTTDLREWREDLRSVREKYKNLNFLHGRQLKVMVDFFRMGDSRMEAEAILQYMFPKLPTHLMKASAKYAGHDKNTIGKQLLCLGKLLDTFDTRVRHVPFQQEETDNPLSASYTHNIFVVSVPKPSLVLSTIRSIPHVIIGLYRQMQRKNPNANQILFCSNATSSDEIFLFLERCFQNSTPLGDIYCLVNAETLPAITKERVIHNIEKRLKRAETSNFLLAFICQEEKTDHFVEKLQQFSKALLISHKELQMSAVTATASHDVAVITITSECPGQGKTAHVKQYAAENNLGVKSLCIEGDISIKTIIEDLYKLGTFKHYLLHIDIKSATHPTELDKTIFQLITLGNLAFRGHCAVCPRSAIAIEIASTIHNKLQESLPYATSFKRKHIHWYDFDNFIIPEDPHSDVQIVAQYLEFKRANKLDHLNVVQTDACLDDSVVKELFRNFFNGSSNSFTVLKGVIAMLADQFKRFSNSDFFKVSTVEKMVQSRHSNIIRSMLCAAIIDQTHAFGPQHIQGACTKHSRPSAAITTGEKLHEAVIAATEAIVKWEDFKHDVLLFNNKDSHTITILCKETVKLSPAIRELFQLQADTHTSDPLKVSEVDWRLKLELITGQLNDTKETVDKRLGNLAKTYTLTRDNVLKMAMILLRLRSKVPVILMGETGCGKTTLIRYLAEMSRAQLHILNVHSGTNRERIVEFMTQAVNSANAIEDVWVFIDEINTCDHQGLISDLISHRVFQGKRVPSNVAFLAACNPYKKREKSTISTAGLDAKTKTMFDETSQLVYRVNPLPVTLLDYVWNYGSLTKDDERKYIAKMLEPVFASTDVVCSVTKDVLTEVVCISQEFMRKYENSRWCVSLRDVHRFREFIIWFYKMLVHKSNFPTRRYRRPNDNVDISFRAIYLALAQSYQVKIRVTSKRKDYWNEISKVLMRETRDGVERKDVANIIDDIKVEQMDILDRMDLPKDIAKNTILLENLFVMFVSILTKTPVFIVGKPGCSKSLSMHLLSTNLRGSGSTDEFFQTLPMFYVIPYQGSEVSTSDGIKKVFRWARGHAAANEVNINWKLQPRFNNEPVTDLHTSTATVGENMVLPVVLLDEIGLAEISPYNPLKVLHSLLETEKGEPLDIAVIGISNWALDAAKMNRAVHVSCPEMEENDLVEIANCVSDSIYEEQLGIEHRSHNRNELDSLKNLARAYLKYIKGTYFHGARDFYSLTKFIITKKTQHQSSVLEPQFIDIVTEGVQRNFGGLKQCPTKEFQHAMTTTTIAGYTPHLKPLRDLIYDNVNDTRSRHLMVISNTTADVSFVSWLLANYERQCQVIVGSQYKGDTNEAYMSSVLSKVILCMERGHILVMKDVKRVYTSLYEMLNQNYSKGRCRIALGPYKNPMCDVHEKFKCVVLMEEQEIPSTDIPFLNRFEKQLFSFHAIQDTYQANLCTILETWVDKFAEIDYRPELVTTKQQKQVHAHVAHSVPSMEENTPTSPTSKEARLQPFTKHDAFVGYNVDTIPSLVVQLCRSNTQHSQIKDIEQTAKNMLLKTTPGDAVLRLSYATMSKTYTNTSELQQTYFANSITQNGLEDFIETFNNRMTDDSNEIRRVVVYTHTPYLTQIRDFVNAETLRQCTTARLSEFNSEKELAKAVEHFIDSATNQWCLIRCTPTEDAVYIPLLKSIVEKHTTREVRKCVVLIVHIDKRIPPETYSLHLSYLDNWHFYTIDHLQNCHKHDRQITIDDVLPLEEHEAISKLLDIKQIVQQNIRWAFSCMKYNQAINVESLENLICKICDTKEIVEFIARLVLEIIRASSTFKRGDIFHPNNWQIGLATNVNVWKGDSIMGVWERYLENKVKQYATIVIAKIHRVSAWESYFTASEEYERKLWFKLAEEPTIVNYYDMMKLDYQSIEINHLPVSLKCPFSRVFTERLQAISSEISTQIAYKSHESELNYTIKMADITECLTDEEKATVVEQFVSPVWLALEPVRNEELYMKQYVHDFYADLVASEFPSLTMEECSQICGMLLFDFKPAQGIDNIRYLTHVLLEYSTQKEHMTALCDLLLHYKNFSLTVGAPSRDSISKDEYIKELCCNMTPTAKLLTDIGLPKWVEKISTFISLVEGTRFHGDQLTTLKILRDFSLIFAGVNGEMTFCEKVGRLCDTIKQSENQEVWQFDGNEFLHALLEIYNAFITNTDMEMPLKHFLASYFERVAFNNELAEEILTLIVDNDMCGQEGLCIGQILEEMLQPLYEDNKTTRTGLIRLLQNDYDVNEEIVKLMDAFFRTKDILQINHPLCLLIIDIFQKELQTFYLKNHEINGIFELQSEYHLICPDVDVKPTIETCAKVAALRLFIETAAKQVRVITGDTQIQRLLDVVFKSDKGTNLPMALFFKSLPCDTIGEIAMVCGRLTDIASFHSVLFSESVFFAIQYNPLRGLEIKSIHDTITAKYLQDGRLNVSTMKGELLKSDTGYLYVQELFIHMAGEYYLPQLVDQGSDSSRHTKAFKELSALIEDQNSNVYVRYEEDVADKLRNLAKTLLGSRPLWGRSRSSNEAEQLKHNQITVFVLHLAIAFLPLLTTANCTKGSHLTIGQMMREGKESSVDCDGQAQHHHTRISYCRNKHLIFGDDCDTCPNCNITLDKELPYDAQTMDNSTIDIQPPIATEIQALFRNAFRCLGMLLQSSTEDLHKHATIVEYDNEVGFSRLQNRCGLATGELYLMLNAMVNYFAINPEDLQEEKCERQCQYLLENRNTITQAYRSKLLEQSCCDPTSIEAQIYEWDSTVPDGTSDPRGIMRIVEMPSIYTLKFELEIQSLKDSSLRLPALVIQMEKHIKLLAHLYPIIAWMRCTRIGLSGLKTAKECTDNLSIEMFCDNKVAQNTFKKFQESWNRLHPAINDLRVVDPSLPDMQRIAPRQSFMKCVASSKNHKIVRVVKALAQIQNRFLIRAFSVCAQYKSNVQFLHASKSLILPVVSLHSVKRQHVVTAEITHDYISDCEGSLQYGQKNNWNYDRGQIERKVAFEYLKGKHFINEDEYEKLLTNFKDTSPCPVGKLIEDVKRVCQPQEQLPKDDSVEEDLINRKNSFKDGDFYQTMQDLLEHILLAISKGNIDPAEEIHKYLQRTFSHAYGFGKFIFTDGDQTSSKETFFKEHINLKLSHVVALYEFIELEWAVEAEQQLLENYRTKLSADGKHEIDAFIASTGATCSELHQVFLKLLVRHIFLERQFQENRESTDDLFVMLQDEFLWPTSKRDIKGGLKQEVENALPRSLKAGEIKSILDYVQTQQDGQIEPKPSASNISNMQRTIRKRGRRL